MRVPGKQKKSNPSRQGDKKKYLQPIPICHRLIFVAAPERISYLLPFPASAIQVVDIGFRRSRVVWWAPIPALGTVTGNRIRQ